ncbi:hypothetical protein [Streptomyces virginiae]
MPLRPPALVRDGTEWWHRSFGDRYEALMTGRPTAPYGPAHLYGVDRAG